LTIPNIQMYSDRLHAAKSLGQRRERTIDGRDLWGDCKTPLVTIVTVAFNSAPTIDRTISSVISQTYRQIEYVVIDGGSTDGTVDIIREWSDRISYWHSAKDFGISDAFNLGIAAAHGEYVGFVNSDDWMSADQIKLLIAQLQHTGAAFAFGRLAHHASDGSLLYHMDGVSDYARDIYWRMPHINHPTVIYRRTAIETVGLFNPRRLVAMDYDWHLRAELRGLRGTYVPSAIGHMTEGGVSQAGWKQGLREVRDIAVQHTNSKFMPNLSYRLRLLRGIVRLAVSRLAPIWLVNVIHRAVNPRYSPVQSKPNDIH
jgi:glycosyltransferase involved in cell wall biosynthesis